jgi:hypothetical protein
MLLNEMVRRMRQFLYQQSATKNREAEEHYSAKLCELRFSTTLRLIASPFREVLRGEKGRRSLTSGAGAGFAVIIRGEELRRS